MRFAREVIPIVLALFSFGLAESHATEPGSQPYIDQLLDDLKSKSSSKPEGTQMSSETPYLDQRRMQLLRERSDPPEGAYLEQLKQTLPEPKGEGSEGYAEKVKSNLPPNENPSAIQNYHEGKSELQFKRPGQIHHAIGLRVSAKVDRQISAAQSGSVNLPFETFYGREFRPEVTAFYEYQPFHSEWLGNIGIVGSLGFNYFSAQGTFGFELPKPGNTGFFSSQARTSFQFFVVPVSVSAIYRFNLLRILRPYVMIGPTLVNYMEVRSDVGASKRGVSTAFTTSLGVALLLDWMSRSASWNLYSDYGVKHFYLTLDYTRVSPLGGDLRFASDSFSGGLTYEF
ncbi:MAG: hypothetical protein ACO3A2_05425 [Bdellovibrionia bacterium]